MDPPTGNVRQRGMSGDHGTATSEDEPLPAAR